jgi:hypothetical protein
VSARRLPADRVVQIDEGPDKDVAATHPARPTEDDTFLGVLDDQYSSWPIDLVCSSYVSEQETVER